MRHIQLKKDYSEQTKNVLLINGEFITFKSKRELNRFAAILNRKINDWLIELNELYISVFAEYRRAWFLMWTHRGYNMKADTVCHTHLNAVEDRFNHLTSRAQGGFVVFIDLKKICMFLTVCCNELEIVHQQKNNTMAKHSIIIANKRIAYLLNEINNYKPIMQSER